MLKYIHLPDDWTAEQASAVLDFIYQLEEIVWDTYEEELMPILGPYPDPPPDDDAQEEGSTDDGIPF